MVLRVMVVRALLALLCAGCGQAKTGERGPDARQACTTAVQHPAKQVISPILEFGSSLQGKIIASKDGISGVEVVIEQIIGTARLERGRTSTDGQGAYRIDRLPAGAYVLVASHIGHAQAHKALWVLPGRNRTAPLALQPSAVIAGRVLDDRGDPIVGVVLEAAPTSSSDEGAQLWRPVQGRSDDRGAFVLDGLVPGAHQLVLRGEGYLTATEERIEAPARGVTVRLVRLHTIEGVVLERSAGGVLMDPPVCVVRIVGSGIWPGRTIITQGRSGRFTIKAVPRGVYEMVAWSQQPPWRATEVLAGLVVGPGPGTPVALELRPAQKISGEVWTSDDKPVAAAVVALGQGSLSVLRYRVNTDTAGRFELPPVVLGRHQLGVWASGYLPAADRTLDLPLDALPLRIELSRGASLAGRVVDQEGRGVAGVLVRTIYRGPATTASPGSVGELGVVPGPVPAIPLGSGSLAPGGVGPELAIPLSSGQTDAAGQFRLSGLQPGELKVLAEHPDYASAGSAWLKITQDDSMRDVGTLLLRMATALSGRVLDERGMPLPQAFIKASWPGGEQSAQTQRDGTFLLRGLAGRVSLTAGSGGYLPVTRRLKLGVLAQQALDLVLEPAKQWVTGYVLDLNRLPVADAQITVRQGAGHTLRGSSDLSGYFLIKGVGSRSLQLEVSRAGYQTRRSTMTPGREVEIRLAYSATLRGVVQDHRTGAPVSRFTVAVAAGAHGRTVAPLQVVSSEGRFKIAELTPGTLRLSVTAPGFAGRVVTVRVKLPTGPGEAGGEQVQVTLRQAGSIAGRVTDLNTGRPLSGAAIRAGDVSASTDTEGRFKLEGIPEGQVVVEVRAGARRMRSDPVSVRPGEAAGPLRLMLP